MRLPVRTFVIGILLAVIVVLTALLSRPLLAAPVQQEGDPVVIAAGDIALCNTEWDTATAALLDSLPGIILGIGDNAQRIGSLEEFTECYEPTWGRHRHRVYPVPGNHEYLTGGAEGYFTYFGDRATPLEPGCRKECKGYYSFNIGAWHIVALNSEIDNNPGSPQDLWLRADLAANPNVCTLAYWHKPRWTSGHHRSGASAPLFQAIYDYGVDIVLSGHDHDYERFAPQNPQGVAEPDRGVRQFVVGTGGADHRGWKSDQLNSEIRDADTWGVLKLTLRPTSYDWEFVPIAGQTFTDKGSANCVTFGSAPTASVGLEPVLVSTTGAAAPAVGNTPAVEVSADLENSGDTANTAAAPAAATLPVAGLDYVVQPGDTLSLISMRYGLDWQVVAQVNGILNTEVIEVGQVIRLPGINEASAVTLVSAPAPAIGGAAAPPAVAADSASYTVVEGDTLFGIALQANVTLQALLAANNMQESDLLAIGQVLVIPGRTTPLRPASAPAAQTTTAVTAPTTTTLLPTATPAPRAVTAATTAAGATPSVHTVAAGETMITIALNYNLDWLELLALNGMEPDSLLQVGQQIRLR